MHVLQIYRDHFADLPGGIERHVHELAQGLSARGIAVETVASANAAPSTTTDDSVVQHVVREFGRPGGVPLAPGILRYARRNFDVVHVHSPNPTAEWAAARRGAGVVATYHADTDRGGPLGSTYRKWLGRTLQRFDRLIVSSERLLTTSPVLARIPKDSVKVEVVPFGVDVQRFSPATNVTRRWGDDPVVLFLGRLRYYKGLRFLIDALATSRARLAIVGDGKDRKEIEDLGRRALGDRLLFLPGVDEAALVDVYRSADVFCLPSTSAAEAFGLAALEAMGCGLPVVTTEVGTATSEINVDGVTGRVVPPRDPAALRDAVEGLLSDDTLRAQLGAAARDRVVKHYDRELMLERIAAVYADVVADRRLPGDG
jgi:rhamnosyl/mannosyltransferase